MFSSLEAESQGSTRTIRSPTLTKHCQTKQLWEYQGSAKKKGYTIILSPALPNQGRLKV